MHQTPSRQLRLLLLLATLWLPGHHAFAHSMNQAAVLLDYGTSAIEAELQLPLARTAQVLHTPITQATLASLQPALTSYLLAHLQATTLAGAAWTVRPSAPLQLVFLDGAPYLAAHLRLTPPASATLNQLLLHSQLLTDTFPHQTVLVSIQSDWNSSTFASDPQLLGILNGTEHTLEIDRAPGSWTRGFSSIFHLGMRHIAEGTDHLLFLLALLLPAPLVACAGRWRQFAGVRHSLTQILKVVTAFTLGHSVTLALAASGLVHVPSRPIEILIAVSILLSAIHALRPLFPGREALIAGSFGLIHGLAFASTLAELGFRGWQRTAGILAFNLGIETMQLIVVLCIMPSLMLLSRTAAYTPFRVAGALFAAFAASGWTLERSLNRSFSVDRVVDALAHHGPLLAALLLASALLATLLSRPQRQHPAAASPRRPSSTNNT